VSHNTIDIGAYEIQWNGINTTGSSPDGLRVWPNPFDDHFTVELDVKEGEPFLIEVFDMMGRKKAEVHRGNLFTGKQQIRLVDLDFPEGLVLLKIRKGEDITLLKLVKSVK
jgi:hypothetical protein